MEAPRLLRTRVARRILMLFMVCAVLPVVTFTVVAYHLTAMRLEADARDALRHSSKLAGMVVLSRLRSLGGELAAEKPTPAFDAVIRQTRGGHLVLLRGTMAPVPPLSAAQESRLAADGTILRAGGPGALERTFLIQQEAGARSGYPRRWGLLARRAITGWDASQTPAPDGTELCLLDGHGTVIDCPSNAAARVLLAGTDDGPDGMRWRRGDSTFLMARWNLFLEREFAAPDWTVALSIPKAAVLGPLAGFRRTFLLGVLLAATLVFLLSHAQLRKRMSPLEELLAGVRRLSAGQFTVPVIVNSDDEFQTLAASFNGMAGDLQRQFTTLTALRSVDIAALEARSAHAIAVATLKLAPTLVGGVRSALAFANPEDPSRWTVLSAGLDGTSPRESIVTLSTKELAELEANVDFLPIPPEGPARSYCPEEHFGRALHLMVFPLRHNGRVHAALIVARGQDMPFGISPMSACRQLADQLAVALDNVTLLGELDALGLGSMLALARTIDAASPWTAGHSERVTETALEIGQRVGLDDTQLGHLRRGGLLHDIGKLGVPTAILDKPGPLTQAERLIVQRHPVIGVDILNPIAAFRDLIPLVRHHHELLDGSGYPDGLTGSSIPMFVRVLTVADIYDALVSDRPYRAGMTSTVALAILMEGAGKQYDSAAVGALAAALSEGWHQTSNAVKPPRFSAPSTVAEHPALVEVLT